MSLRKSCFSKTALLLGLIAYASDSVYYVYTSKYITTFTDEYKLKPKYLNWIQGLFMIWNFLNDPLIGYFQDFGVCGMDWIKDRRKVVMYAGPIFAASFVLFWFPWSTSDQFITSLHLYVSLFIYDTLLTLVMSAYCSLCVEKSQKHGHRVRITIYGELFTILAGILIFPLEYIRHTGEDYWKFQMSCVLIALIAGVMMPISAYFLKVKKPTNDVNQQNQEEAPNPLAQNERHPVVLAIITFFQIVFEPEFICLVGAQFFKILRFMANENYLIALTETLLVNNGYFEKNSATLGGFYMMTRSFGSLLFLALWYPTNRFGPKAVTHFLNIISVVNCFCVFFCTAENLTANAIFILIENTVARCGWQGFYIVMAGEVVDADMKRNHRKSPFSTFIFTLKALFNKPADQLASIIIMAFLKKASYPAISQPCGQLFLNSTLTNSSMMETSVLMETSKKIPVTMEQCEDLAKVMLETFVAFSLVCAIMESSFMALNQLWNKGKAAK